LLKESLLRPMEELSLTGSPGVYLIRINGKPRYCSLEQIDELLNYARHSSAAELRAYLQKLRLRLDEKCYIAAESA